MFLIIFGVVVTVIVSFVASIVVMSECYRSGEDGIYFDFNLINVMFCIIGALSIVIFLVVVISMVLYQW